MSSEKRSIDPTTIIVTVISVIGTIVAALITVYAGRTPAQPTATPPTVVFSTPTNTDTPIPTDTVPPGEPTSTPAPDTPTPTPTFTPVPPVAIGEDWKIGCISMVWLPYPATIPVSPKGDGCWQEPVYIFSADGGSLSFLNSRSGSGPVEIYGLFAPLPESGAVSVKVRLKDLDNVDLWLGVFATPDVTSQGLLMTIPAGNVRQRLIVQKDVSTYKTLQKTQPLDQGDGFMFTFRFDTLSSTGIVDPNVFVTNPVSIPSAQKWLFLGYRGLSGGYRVEGSFLNFALNP